MTKKKTVVGALAIALVFAISGCGGTIDNDADNSYSSSNTKAEQQQVTLQQRALKNADKDAPADGVQALKKGILYAETMHMSKAGVYQQLISEYGKNFSPEAAKWAVAHMSDIDWNKQALEKAKQYREIMNMSREAIREQLMSSAGEKFTPEEAQYAISHLDD